MKCSACYTTIRSHNKSKICMKCRKLRKCSGCGNKLHHASSTGYCKYCVRLKEFRSYTPKSFVPTKILECEKMSFIDTAYHLDYILEEDFNLHWKAFYSKYTILYKNIMFYTKDEGTHNFKDRIGIFQDKGLWKRMYQSTSSIYSLYNNGPVAGYVKFKNKYKHGGDIGTIEYYIRTHGDKKGEELYYARYTKLLNSQIKQYSKISKELFDNLKCDDAYYAEEEWRITLFEDERKKLNQIVMFVDFKLDDKIIEFDGDYWHQNSIEKDKLRDSILTQRGFDVLRVKESDYKKDKQKVLKLCLKFLNDL